MLRSLVGSEMCIRDRYNTYTCDCTGTMYTGPYCEEGFIRIAALPQLILNEESSSIEVLARPTGFLKIRLSLFSPHQLLE